MFTTDSRGTSVALPSGKYRVTISQNFNTTNIEDQTTYSLNLQWQIQCFSYSTPTEYTYMINEIS